jgi:hypothetical protein
VPQEATGTGFAALRRPVFENESRQRRPLARDAAIAQTLVTRPDVSGHRQASPSVIPASAAPANKPETSGRSGHPEGPVSDAVRVPTGPVSQTGTETGRSPSLGLGALLLSRKSLVSTALAAPTPPSSTPMSAAPPPAKARQSPRTGRGSLSVSATGRCRLQRPATSQPLPAPTPYRQVGPPSPSSRLAQPGESLPVTGSRSH